MVSAGTLLRAPRIIWEVSMAKKRCLNEYQNMRTRNEYVRAFTEAEAKREAERKHPEFKAMSARRAP